MSIIVPSNHTRIGAWVNSKMSGRLLLLSSHQVPFLSIQYLLFLTLQGKGTNFRGHRLAQTMVLYRKIKIKKTERKSQHFLRKNIIQVPRNNKFRKTRSRLGQENPKKEVEPIAPRLGS